jgi:RHS repeat-associated protein
VNNFLQAVINALGESNRFTYNNFGQVETVTDPRGFSLTNSYDPSNGDLLVTRDPLGNATENAYDDRGLVKGTRTPVGAISTNYYDAYGTLLASASYDLVGGSPVLHTTNSYAYDANGNRTNAVAWRRVNGVWVGSTNVYCFDAQNRLIKAIDDSGTNATTYNAIGQAETVTDKLGRTTRYDYDAHGRLTKTTYPDTSFELSHYDAAARRTNSVDRAGRATAYSYDPLGQLTQVKFSDGSATRTVYDALGRLRFRVDAMGVTNAYGYNTAGRLVSVTNALGVAGIQTVYGYGYDASGNTVYFTNALNVVTTNVYDSLGRLVQVKNPDGTTVSTAYDGVGRKVAVTNQDNVVTLFGYDGLGQLVAVTNALGTPEQMVTRYEYDQAGNLLKVIDALNRTNSYTYDNLGRRLSHTMPNPSLVERFAYDRAGNLVYHTNFNNVVITNQYDLLDRLTNRSSISGYKVAFSYGPLGERLTMTDPSGNTAYGYDTRGRLLLKTVSWTGGPTLALNYLYNAQGNVTNIWSGSSGGVNLHYQYDALARITNVLTAGVSAAAYQFDAIGNLKSIRYGNGVTNLYQYDALNRLTNSTWWSNQLNLATFYYKLGKAGNRTNLTEFVKDTSRTKSWSYDSLYRVTSESLSDLGNLTYGYDKVGNRTNRQSTVVQLPTANYSYNTNDWLSSDTYDNNGNTTVAGVNTYNYDPVNQVTNVNSGAVRMWYDGDGLRVKKQVGTTVTYYLWDDRNLSGYVQVLEEHKSVGGGPVALDKAYDYGLDLVRQRQGATTHYFGYDGQGSTRFLLDNSGSVYQTFTYDAYGTLIASSGSPATVYLYCGEQFDPDVGFYYLRARFLNPSTGRFQTMDSFAGVQNDPLSLHKYLYAANDPVNRIDPSGHESLVGVSVGSSIAGSLSAMYNGVVSAVGTALQMTIMGVHAGKSAEEILLEFILDQTGLQLVIDAAGLATDLFSSIKDLLLKQMGEEEVNIAEFYVSFDTYVMPWITDEPEGLDVVDEIFSSPQCLAAGTLIETDIGYKPIEQVQAGDWVWAWNNDAGSRELKKVLRTFSAERAELVEIRVGGALIVTTIEHSFFTRDRVWKAAGHLAAGDALFDEENPAGHVIDSVTRTFDSSTVYNMEVEDLHNYFISGEGILTHNLGAGYNHFFQNAFVKATRGNSIKYGKAALGKARYLGKAAHNLSHKKFNAFL